MDAHCVCWKLLLTSVVALGAQAAPPPVGTPWSEVVGSVHPKPVTGDTWLLRPVREEETATLAGLGR